MQGCFVCMSKCLQLRTGTLKKFFPEKGIGDLERKDAQQILSSDWLASLICLMVVSLLTDAKAMYPSDSRQ